MTNEMNKEITTEEKVIGMFTVRTITKRPNPNMNIFGDHPQLISFENANPVPLMNLEIPQLEAVLEEVTSRLEYLKGLEELAQFFKNGGKLKATFPKL